MSSAIHPTDAVSAPLRISDMVTPRRIPPESGWRNIVYRLSSGTLNPGESNSDKQYRELRDRIRRHIRKHYVVTVLSGKGGVGKTTLTTCIGGVFSECRSENVVAIDAVPGFGTLAGRIDETPPGDYSAVLDDTDIQGYADIREYLGQNNCGLDVLAGNRSSDQPRPLDPAMFDGVLSRLRRTHSIIVVDTADDLEHASMKAVLDSSDCLVFVSGLTPDSSLPVTRSIDLLRSMGYHDLVARSMVVLNNNRNRDDDDARRLLVERFSQSGPSVEYMPYDGHLAEGGIIDTSLHLGKRARLRLFQITAALADKYVPDSDRSC